MMETNENMGLKSFLEIIEDQLDKLSKEEVNEIILQQAIKLKPSERESFIQRLSIKNIKSTIKESKHHKDHALISDINEFIQKVEEDSYSEGWGWDPEIHDEREFGDESWVDEIDELFERVDDAFLAGDMKLSRICYEKLLSVFINENSLPCQDSPEKVVSTDLNQAKARYLRSLYETSPKEEKAKLIYTYIEDYHYIGDLNFRVTAIKEAYPQKIQGWNDFLKSLKELIVKELISLKKEVLSFRNPSEVVWSIIDELDGLSGFQSFAEEYGDKIQEVYKAWFSRLSKQNKHNEILKFYLEFSKKIKDKEIKAEVSDIVLNSAEILKNKNLSLRASQEAFLSEPNLTRLISYRNQSNDKEKVMKEIITFLEKNPKEELKQLLAQAYILNDEHEKIWNFVKNEKPLGWSFGGNPLPIAIPFLMISAVRGKNIKEGSALNRIWKNKKVIGDESEEEFKEIVDKGILVKSISDKKRLEQLSWVKNKIEERVNAIVSGKHRYSYDKAALLLVACSNAFNLLNKRNEAESLMEHFMSKYNRHIAFKREVNLLGNK